MNFTHKLFFKLLVFFILISILPLLLAGWLSYNHSSRILNNEIDKEAANILAEKLTTLNLLMNDLQRMAEILAKNNTVSTFLNNQDAKDKYYQLFTQLDPFLDSLQPIRPETIGITLISDKQLIYFYGYSFHHDKDPFLANSWLPDLSQIGNAPYITSPHARPYDQRYSDQQVFSFVQQIWSQTFSSQGVLVVDFPVEVLEQWFGGNTTQSASGTFIIDQKGNILYPQMPSTLSREYAKLQNQQRNSIALPNGVHYRVFRKTVPQIGWTIVSYFPDM